MNSPRKVQLGTLSLAAAAVIVIASLFVLLALGESMDQMNVMTTNALNIGIMFTILAGFLMSISLTRQNALSEHVNLELNKIRRINHLAFNIASCNKDLVLWFVELRRAIAAYLDYFKRHDFGSYDGSSVLFREVTAHVYSLPRRSLPYNSELYAALLDTVASATEAREHISSSLPSFITRLQWGTIMAVTIMLAFATALLTPSLPHARLSSIMTDVCLFLILGMIYEAEALNSRRRRHYADLYVANWSKFDKESLEEML